MVWQAQVSLLPQQQATAHFAMGFAYLSLATVAPHTALDLLSRAVNSYSKALSFCQATNLPELIARTSTALGDVYATMAQLLVAGRRSQYLSNALNQYHNAQRLTSSEPLRLMLKDRVTITSMSWNHHN
jgi:hypothetical protein